MKFLSGKDESRRLIKYVLEVDPMEVLMLDTDWYDLAVLDFLGKDATKISEKLSALAYLAALIERREESLSLRHDTDPEVPKPKV